MSTAGAKKREWVGSEHSLVLQGDYLVATSFRTNTIWDLRTYRRVHLFETPRGPVSTDVQGRVLALSQSLDSSSFGSIFSPVKRSITLLNTQTGEALLSLPTKSSYYQIQFIGSAIYGLTAKGTLEVWQP